MPPRRRAAAPTPEEQPAPRRRNTAADSQFIQKAAEAGQVQVVQGHLVWTGRNEDLLHPYQVAPEDRRCQHMRQVKDDDGGPVLNVDMEALKQRCPNWAMLGAALCVQHAKGSRAVMDEARQMIAGAALALTGQLISDALSAPFPSDRIKAINSLLDRFGLRGGIEVGPDMPAWRQVMDELAKETGTDE